jgi:hypothetical protein
MGVVAESCRHSQVLQTFVVALKAMTVRYLMKARRVSHGSRVARSVAELEETTVHIRVLQKLDSILVRYHRCTRM